MESHIPPVIALSSNVETVKDRPGTFHSPCFYLMSSLMSGIATAEKPMEYPPSTVPRYRVRMAWSSRARPDPTRDIMISW